MRRFKREFFLLLIVVFASAHSPFPSSAAGTTVSDPIAPTNDLTLPFGEFSVGKSSEEQIITLTNTDAVAVSLPALSLSGSDAFKLNLNGGDSPCGEATTFTLAAGAQCTLSVTYTPTVKGEHSAFINITTDDEEIAFHDPATKGISLYNVDTGNIIPLTTPPTGGRDDFPSWSPGRNQIVFHRLVGNLGAIYRVNVDGTGLNFLVNRGTEPNWSTNGQKIVMSDKRFGGITVLDLNLNTFTAVAGTGLPANEGRHPRWSPDGTQIVFNRINFPSGNDIYIVNEDGTGSSPIAIGGGTPAWAPDGKEVLFHKTANSGISIINLGPPLGTSSPLTSPSNATDSRPTWAPDSISFAFQRDTSTGTPQIIKMKKDGPGQVQLTGGETPAWSPASKALLTLFGTGLATGANSPPSAPQLISPTDGQADLGANVTFKFLSSVDPDGDLLTYTLLLCESSIFNTSDCNTPTAISATKAAVPPNTTVGLWVAGGGTLLFGMLFTGQRKQRQRVLFSLFAFIFLFFTVSGCGSSGGGNTAPSGGTEASIEIEHTIENLPLGVNHSWQITADDGKGGVTSSVVWRFTT